jgi:hypothetical protein
MSEGIYSNVGHRGPVYKGLGAMNPCDNLSKERTMKVLKLTDWNGHRAAAAGRGIMRFLLDMRRF